MNKIIPNRSKGSFELCYRWSFETPKRNAEAYKNTYSLIHFEKFTHDGVSKRFKQENT